MQSVLRVLALGLCCLTLSDCQRRRIDHLPRLSFRPSFAQYSGYLNSTDNRRLFYWLVESSDVPPSTAPLVLWMNGGPGCSSVGGLLMTNGPFLANDRAELERNEFAWNRLANMLYIDSPSGVGLSDPGPVSPSVLNDQATTQLNLRALLHFYELFPEFKGRPFYIAGESYAGVYIPLLAGAIVSGGHRPGLINLTGIAVGNGLHVRFDMSAFEELRRALTETMGASIGNSSVYTVAVQKNEFKTLNPYNIAEPCYENRRFDSEYPCLNSTSLVTYLNDWWVRAALGVDGADFRRYSICSRRTYVAYKQLGRDVLPELAAAAGAGISVLLYHGALDYLFPLGITLRLLEGLPMDSEGGESAWFYCSSRPNFGAQIGGVQRSYMNGRIRHRTVIGAGHSVATDRPEVGLQILADLLAREEAAAPNYPAELISSCSGDSLELQRKPHADVSFRSSASSALLPTPMWLLLTSQLCILLWAQLRCDYGDLKGFDGFFLGL